MTALSPAARRALSLRTALAVVLAAAALAAPAGRAQTFTWDPAQNGSGSGGPGSWDLTTTNWYDGANDIVWPNTATSAALFGGTGGTVSLAATTIQANALTFNVTGYTIDNGGTAANVLTLAGTTPTITVTNAPDTATISAIIAGTAGLTKAGAGTLVLSGTNTFSGTVAVNAGTLQFGASGNLGTGTALTLGTATTAATLSYTGSSLSLARTLALGTFANNVINVATAGQTLTLTGNITGGPAAGTTALTITGAGVLFINNGTAANNTFTGNFVVDGGGLQIVGQNGTAGDSLQLGPASKSITLTNGGRFINTTTTFNPTSTNTKSIVIGIGGGTIDATAQISLDDPGQFGGTGILTKIGTNNLVLGANGNGFGGAAGYTGGLINLNAGTLTLANEQAAGGGTGGTIAAINMATGTILQIKKDTAGVTFGNNITATGSVTFDTNRNASGSGQTLTLGTLTLVATGAPATSTVNVTGANAYSIAFGVTTLSGDTTFNTTTAFNTTLAAIDAGAAAPARTITKTGNGFLTVTGAGANFTGTTLVNSSAGGVAAGTATSFGPAATVTVTGTLSQYSQTGAAAAGYTYSLPADGVLGGDNAFLASLNTTGAGANINLFPTTIAQSEVGANAALATRVSFANDASRYFGYGANLSENVTVGTGTPWIGLSNDRLSRVVTGGTITANSDFTVRAITVNGSTFTLGNGAVGPAIAFGPGVTTATVSVTGGTVLLNNSAAASYTSAVTFAVANGGSLQTVAVGSLGTNATPANNAKVNVLSGGILNPNAGATLNGNVTIQVGGVLNIDDGANITGNGTITQFAGSITRITSNGATALSGTQSPGTVPGSIVRLTIDDIRFLGTGTAGATSPAANYVVNYQNSTAVNGVNFEQLATAASLTLSSAGDVTVTGTTLPIPTGVLTNDTASRILAPSSTSTTTATNATITVGAGGATIAATTGTTFTIRGNPTASAVSGVNIAAGANVLNINLPAGAGTIDGSAKAGTVAISGPAGTSVVAGSVNVLSGTLQDLSGGIAYTIGGGTGVTRIFSGAQLNSSTATLFNSTLQIDSGAGTVRFSAATAQIAGLSGVGNLVIGPATADTTARVLTVGSNNASTSYTGIISQTGTGTGNGGITKTGTGTLTLGGVNTYTGPTAVNLGTLALGGGSLGATAVTVGSGATPTATAGNATLLIQGNRTIGTATAGGLTVTGGSTGGTPIGQGTLSLVDGTVNTLTLVNRTPTDATTFTFGSNTNGNNAVYNVEVGAAADQVVLGAGDTAAIGTSTTPNVVNVVGLGGYAGGTLPIITAPGGLAAGSFGSFALGTVTGNTLGYTFALSATATTLSLVGTAPTGPAAAYWTGSQSSVWTTNNAGLTNFATDATGATNTGALPVVTTNVFFTATAATNLTTTLGADFAINSLTFTGTGTAATSPVTIAGNTLTIAATAANGNTAGVGIVIAAGSGAHTISSNVFVNASQSWTNNSTSLFTVSGNVGLGVGGAVLTVAGAGDTTLSGVVSGTGGLTKSGASTLTLAGANTYTGGATTVLAGTVNVTGAANNAAGNGALVLGSVGGASNALNLGATSQAYTSLLVNNATAVAATNLSTITVAAGQTLAVNGNFTVGPNPVALVTNNASRLVVTGGGALAVTSTGGTVQVGGATGANNLASSLDLTGLSAVTIALGATGTVRVNQPTGTNVAGNQSSLLFPTPTAGVTATTPVTTVTANNFNIGDNGGNGSGANQINSVVLGTGLTTLNVNNLNVGTGARDVGSLTFAAGNGTVQLRGATGGTSRTAVSVGGTNGVTGVGNGSGVTGMLADFTGHAADLLVSTLTVGNQGRSTNQTYAFRFDTGTLNATGVVVSSDTVATTNVPGAAITLTSTVAVGGGATTIGTGGVTLGTVSGTRTGSTTAGTAASFVGNFNVTGGTVAIGTTGTYSVLLGNVTNANAFTSANDTFNITGGAVTVAGPIIALSTTRTTSTLTLNGGTLNMAGQNVGTAAIPVTFNARAGTLDALGELNGGTGAPGVLTKTTAGTLTLTGASGYTGGTAINGGTVLVNGQTGVQSGTGTGTVTVTTGTLGGSGQVGGAVNVAASTGTLTPGLTALNGNALTNPTLTVGGATVTLASGAGYGFNISFAGGNDSSGSGLSTSGGNNNTLAVTAGTLSLTSPNVIVTELGNFASSYTPGNTYSWTLASTTGGVTLAGTPTFNVAAAPTLAASGFTLATFGNNLVLNYFQPVPEPATVFGLAAAGLAAAGFVRRRRPAAK